MFSRPLQKVGRRSLPVIEADGSLKPARVLRIKILSLGDPERYAVRRMVVSALQEVLKQCPGLDVRISEVDRADEIGKYAQVLVLPTLVINEEVLCTGRYPSRLEVIQWLKAVAYGG